MVQLQVQAQTAPGTGDGSGTGEVKSDGTEARASVDRWSGPAV